MCEGSKKLCGWSTGVNGGELVESSAPGEVEEQLLYKGPWRPREEK